MKKTSKPEISYLVQYVLPFLASQYGYPPPDDEENVKINEIPVRIASGIKKPDVVYYWQGIPVLLIEAKKEGKSDKDALDQALSYVRNFPTKEYSKSGYPPRYLIITIGKDNIILFERKYEIEEKNLKDWADKIDGILSFKDLLKEYGLSAGYVPQILPPRLFRYEFLHELMAIYNLNEDKKITRDVIFNVSSQILNYLEDPKNYTSRQPYVLLDRNKDRQAQIRQLFDQYDIIHSLNPNNAKEFRNFVLRSFQGGELDQYMTERCVIAFMSDLVEIQKDWKVLDFECGSGGFLAAAVEKGGIELNNLLGIDIDELPYIVSKTYLAIFFGKSGKADIASMPVKNANGLFYYENNWDLVIGNPAGSNIYPNNDIGKVLENLESDLDQNGRLDSFSEYNLSIQQAVRSAKVGGRICLILPEGFFSNSQDEVLRKYVANHCKILAIISLPRGVFKKGTTTKQAKKGSQSASMKMSILYAQKIKEVKDGEGVESDIDLNYPVFIANIEKPDSCRGEIKDWLEPILNIVFEQWKDWKEHGKLTEPSKETTNALKLPEFKLQPYYVQQKLPLATGVKSTETPKVLPKQKSTIKIDDSLKKLFKK